MASVNKVILIGRLGKDPELREAGSTTVCNLSVATSRSYKSNGGDRKEETEWHDVVLFGKSAEIAKKFLTKGSSIYVEGRIQSRSYTTKDGRKAKSFQIVGESFQFLSSPRGKVSEAPVSNGPEDNPNAPYPTEDIPF